jgi:hypothetical protein
VECFRYLERLRLRLYRDTAVTFKTCDTHTRTSGTRTYTTTLRSWTPPHIHIQNLSARYRKIKPYTSQWASSRNCKLVRRNLPCWAHGSKEHQLTRMQGSNSTALSNATHAVRSAQPSSAMRNTSTANTSTPLHPARQSRPPQPTVDASAECLRSVSRS